MLLADDDEQAPIPKPGGLTPSLPTMVEQSKHLITLNAISTTKCAQGRVIHLEGFILHIPIHVFIDSGVDQSFLNPQVAARLGLQVDTIRTEAVMVATGRCFRTKEAAHQVLVRL